MIDYPHPFHSDSRGQSHSRHASDQGVGRRRWQPEIPGDDIPGDCPDQRRQNYHQPMVAVSQRSGFGEMGNINNPVTDGLGYAGA